MRVITGSARGRRLKALEGQDVRPTTDRVKEAVFSIIQFEIEGRNFLDLFAGSGQMGIEALSRGAAKAVFIGQRAVDEGHVDGQQAAAEQVGHLAEEARGHRAVSLGNVLALVGADENAVDQERILVFGFAERGRAFGDVEAGDEWVECDVNAVKAAVRAVNEGRTALNPKEIKELRNIPPIRFYPHQKECLEWTKKMFKKE